jgi:hypothetical protein
MEVLGSSWVNEKYGRFKEYCFDYSYIQPLFRNPLEPKQALFLEYINQQHD